MGFSFRSTVRTASGLRPATFALVGIVVTSSAHANPDLVEGVFVSGTDTMRVDLGYRCEGQDCGFEAVLHGVLPEDVAEYEWRFGDGKTTTTVSPLVDHRWAEPGEQNVTLWVHDQYCDPLVVEASLSILPTDPAVGLEPLAAESVRLAQDGTRVASEPLQGTTIGGDVFVFLQAPEVAESVTFRLFDAPLDGRTLRVDDAAPFDMAGGAVDSASPFDTRELANGAYRLDVSVVYPGAVEDVVSVDFEVHNAVNVPVAEAPIDGGTEEPPMGGATPDGTPTDGDDGGETPTDGTTPTEPEAGNSDGTPTEETPDASPTDGMTPEEPGTPMEETADTVPTDGDFAPAGDGGETPTGGTTLEEPAAPTEETPDTMPTDGGDVPAGNGGETSTDETDSDVFEPTGELVFSTKADRSGGDPLAGARVRGRIYVRLEGSDDVSSVRFFIDDPAQGGEPFNVDTRAPWDAAGGSRRRAKPIRTRHLGRGRHVLSAEVVESGITYTVHASFTVGR